MTERHDGMAARLRAAVLESDAETDRATRRAVEQRAAVLGGREDNGPAEVPKELRDYVDKVARHAYRVTDQDVLQLRHLGYSEDEVFEVTASAALGAGLGRLERAYAALRGEV